MLGNRSFPLFVALRYLKSTRRDAFISFLSATAAAGIALGVAALILALGALSGFQDTLKSEILARTPELEVELAPGADPSAVERQVAAMPEVESVQVVAEGRGWIVAAGRARPVVLVGFEGELPRLFPDASDRAAGVYVSDQLAEIWGLEAGEVVELASARPTLSPLGPLPRVRRLPVAGTFGAGRTEQEERVALPLAAARALLGGGRHRLVIATGDLDRALHLAPRLAGRLPENSLVRTWSDLNRALLFALRLEKGLMFVAVFLIVVVAAMSLVSDLNLILASKRPEIGMLGAMGATPASVRRIFLWLGGLLVAGGTLAGLVLGVAGAFLLDRYRVFRLPGEVFFLDHVPFHVRPVDLLVIVAATGALSLWCARYAAGRAAALQPVDALRR